MGKSRWSRNHIHIETTVTPSVLSPAVPAILLFGSLNFGCQHNQHTFLCSDLAKLSNNSDQMVLKRVLGSGIRAVQGVFLHSTGTARAQCVHTGPMVGKFSRDHPENPPPTGELRPQGKNSRFRQQSGISSGKYGLF